MGIKGLFQVLSDQAPGAIRITEMKALTGRKVAIDASMSLYQFLIAVRQRDGMQLSSNGGDTTSHLMGIFYRTLKMVENGLKPCYVFDGKPPELKGDELKKRLVLREAATKKRDELKEQGDLVEMARFERRTVTVSQEQTQEVKELLKLMGIPIVEAPGEAEAQCAALAKANKVYAAVSEDMDTLTFGTPILIRHLTASDQQKKPVTEVDLQKALKEMGLSEDEFIDMCILLGCDYCDSVRGLGRASVYKLIQQHRSIENIKKALAEKGGKVQIPDEYPFEQVRKLFHSPDTLDLETVQLKWTAPDADGLVEFLCRDRGFSEERVRTGAAKLAKGSSSFPQGRLTDFFGLKRKEPAKAKDPKKDTKKPRKK